MLKLVTAGSAAITASTRTRTAPCAARVRCWQWYGNRTVCRRSLRLNESRGHKDNQLGLGCGRYVGFKEYTVVVVERFNYRRVPGPPGLRHLRRRQRGDGKLRDGAEPGLCGVAGDDSPMTS